MTGRRIAITIGRDGTIRAETLGIQGKECLDYVPLLEELLEAEVVRSAFTADYAANPAHAVEDREPAIETVREQPTS